MSTNLSQNNQWKRAADLADIVEDDDQIRSRIRLAVEWHLKATKALAEGDLDHFLALAELAGYSATRTRYGTYNAKLVAPVMSDEDMHEAFDMASL